MLITVQDETQRQGRVSYQDLQSLQHRQICYTVSAMVSDQV